MPFKTWSSGVLFISDLYTGDFIPFESTHWMLINCFSSLAWIVSDEICRLSLSWIRSKIFSVGHSNWILFKCTYSPKRSILTSARSVFIRTIESNMIKRRKNRNRERKGKTDWESSDLVKIAFYISRDALLKSTLWRETSNGPPLSVKRYYLENKTLSVSF